MVSDSTDEDRTELAAAFAVAFGAYVGIVLSGAAATVLVASDVTVQTVVAGSAAGFVLGAAAGVALARATDLVIAVGHRRRRGVVLYAPVVPGSLVAGRAWLGPLESTVGGVALGATFAVFASAYVVGALVRTRYVASIADDEPRAAWRWEPSGSALYGLLAAGWFALAALNVVGADWLGAAVWAGLGVLWIVTGVVEGRFGLDLGATPEVRVHEAGIVTRRPYTHSLIPWDDVDHVRLREGELVLDRGLFDVRFDRGELEDADAVYEALERRLSAR